MAQLSYARVVDNFNRADQQLNGSGWTKRHASSTTDPRIVSNQLSNDTTAGFFPSNYTAAPTTNKDQYIALTVGSFPAWTGTGLSSAVFLRCSNTATSGTVPGLWFTHKQLSIQTMTSWAAAGGVVRSAFANANAGGVAMVAGDFLEFRCIADVYTTYCNGVLINTWADTGLVVTQGQNYIGVGIQRGTDGVAGNPVLDDLIWGDARPTQLFGPWVPTVSRAASR